MDTPIYLDYNATTPIAREAAEAMRPFLDARFGNPSSSHLYGFEAREAVAQARLRLAGLLGCEADEIVFTSGGTESNNMAIIGTARALRDRGHHIVTTSIEHPAVSEVTRFLESEGFRITWVGVDATGRVDPRDVEAALTPETILISVMHANNEVGTIQPIEAITRMAHARGVRVHSDGAQAVGKIGTRLDSLGVDLYSIAGHKMYAPKGVGALFVRRGTTLAKFMHGANHEQNRRAGTENVMEIVGLGMAAEIARHDPAKHTGHLRAMRDRLHQAILARVDDARLNGHPEERLPNTLSLGFPGLRATTILGELAGVAASAGAACHADSIEISTVLRAMRVPEDIAIGTIRFSVGRETTGEQVERAADEIGRVIAQLRAELRG